MRSYDLSAQNRILAVSEDWDHRVDFSSCAAQAIMGRPIWDFVLGLETRSYLNALFFTSRSSGKALEVGYRCDSPELRRPYTMQVEPLEAGGLRVSHVPGQPIPRPHAVVALPRDQVTAFCSQCLSWLAGDHWIDAPCHHGLLGQALEFVVCPICRAAARRAIDASLGLRRVQ